jgi:uncharacterized membrane protein YphA (DoxX/SURF4 family)
LPAEPIELVVVNSRRRFPVIWIFISLLALRLVIGWHFYCEGVDKLKRGDFTAEPFLRAAQGPLAEFYAGWIPDHDGRFRLGLVETRAADGKIQAALQPVATETLWRGFAYRAARHYGFSDAGLIEDYRQRVEELSRSITGHDRQSAPGTKEVMAAALEESQSHLRTVEQQKTDALAIVQRYGDAYRALLAENEPEILAYFAGADRASGFDKDGPWKRDVASSVPSLRLQVREITGQRARDVQPWLAEIDLLWDGVEADINALSVGTQLERGFLSIERPHQNGWSPLPWLNRCVPWFDTIVGGCLLLGLLTRPASLAAMAFLAMIISTQMPLPPGSTATFPLWIELCGLFVLFATAAGRFGGLDVWIDGWRSRRRAAVAETTGGAEA